MWNILNFSAEQIIWLWHNHGNIHPASRVNKHQGVWSTVSFCSWGSAQPLSHANSSCGAIRTPPDQVTSGQSQPGVTTGWRVWIGGCCTAKNMEGKCLCPWSGPDITVLLNKHWPTANVSSLPMPISCVITSDIESFGATKFTILLPWSLYHSIIEVNWLIGASMISSHSSSAFSKTFLF